MFRIVVIFFLLVANAGCNNSAVINLSTKTHPQNDSGPKTYSDTLDELENASINKKSDSLGILISKISFQVKTEDKHIFKVGIIPWADIANPTAEITNLVDKDKIVIPENKATVIIDYPLTNAYRCVIESKTGFTRTQLLKLISENYYKLYDEEERSATVKTIPVKNRTKLYNRNETNGKYGIWGHDIADLALAEILVYKTTDGQIILSLNMES
jgi:hypothetical protein